MFERIKGAISRGPAEVRKINPLELAKPRADPATADPRVLYFNDGTTFEGSSVVGTISPLVIAETAAKERVRVGRRPLDEEDMGDDGELEAPLAMPVVKARPALGIASATALLAVLDGNEDEKATHAPEKIISNIVEAVAEGNPEALEALSHALGLAAGGVMGLGEMALMLHKYANIKREDQHIDYLLKKCQGKRKTNPGDKDLESLEKCLGYAQDQLGKKSNRLKVKIASTLGQLTGAAASLAGGAAGGIIVVASTGTKLSIPLYQVGRSVYKRLAGTRGEMRTMFARGVFELARVDHGTRNADAQRMAKNLLVMVDAGKSSPKDAFGKLKKFASSMA